MNQGDFLRAAREVLGFSREELAEALQVKKRTLDNWFLPQESSEFRNMPDEIRTRIHQLLHERGRTSPSSGMTQKCSALLVATGQKDYVRLDWGFVGALAEDRQREIENLISIYVAPIAAWLADPAGRDELGVALQPLATRVEELLTADPKILGTKAKEAKSLSILPRCNRHSWKSLASLLGAYRDRLDRVHS